MLYKLQAILSALKLYLNADSGLSRQLITSILTQLWNIQKWMHSQKVFQFYSSSILIVYDARKLRQVLEMQKRQNSSQNTLELSGNGNPLSGGEVSPPANLNKNELSSGFVESLSDITKTPPKSVYKKIQRSHSSTNNYDKVSNFQKNVLFF